MASPDLADWPDMAATSPSLMVSWAIAGPATTAAQRRRLRPAAERREICGKRSLGGHGCTSLEGVDPRAISQGTCQRRGN